MKVYYDKRRGSVPGQGKKVTIVATARKARGIP